MRKGRVRQSAAWLMIAMLTTCALSTAVFSGENPWDSDHRPNQSTQPPSNGTDTTATRCPDARTANATGSAASWSGSGWMAIANEVVFYVARHHGAWLKNSTRQQSVRSETR